MGILPRKPGRKAKNLSKTPIDEVVIPTSNNGNLTTPIPNTSTTVVPNTNTSIPTNTSFNTSTAQQSYYRKKKLSQVLSKHGIPPSTNKSLSAYIDSLSEDSFSSSSSFGSGLSSEDETSTESDYLSESDREPDPDDSSDDSDYLKT